MLVGEGGSINERKGLDNHIKEVEGSLRSGNMVR